MANLQEKKQTYNTSNYNSIENQNIKDKFVNQNIRENLNLIIQHLNKSEDKGDWGEEIYNVSSCPNYEAAAEAEDWFFDEDNDVWKNNSTEEIYQGLEYDTAQEVCEEENLDYDYFEAYEFWSVSTWLGEKLKEQGEMVENVFGWCVWGRCTTGQAISLDYVISKVCEGLEILEGQKSDWSKQNK